MYGQLTVSELRQQLQNLENRGLGDCKVVLSDDEECNGYHGAFSGAEAGADIAKDFEDNGLDASDLRIYDSETDELKELVVIS